MATKHPRWPYDSSGSGEARKLACVGPFVNRDVYALRVRAGTSKGSTMRRIE
jgi:hypothetical protein